MPHASPLLHLAEECGETVQAALKLHRFGPDSSSPDEILPKSNVEALEEECGDILALVKVLTDLRIIDPKRLKARVKFKHKKYSKFYSE